MANFFFILWHRFTPAAIVGGPRKAGTGLLREVLLHHPDVFMVPKEVHYFNIEANWQKGKLTLDTNSMTQK